MKLINSRTRQEIKIGDKVTTFRGDKGTLASIEAPRHAGSTGRVYVKLGKHAVASFFPSVIGAEIIEEVN